MHYEREMRGLRRLTPQGDPGEALTGGCSGSVREPVERMRRLRELTRSQAIPPSMDLELALVSRLPNRRPTRSASTPRRLLSPRPIGTAELIVVARFVP
jgi:hypothetical protein